MAEERLIALSNGAGGNPSESEAAEKRLQELFAAAKVGGEATAEATEVATKEKAESDKPGQSGFQVLIDNR